MPEEKRFTAAGGAEGSCAGAERPAPGRQTRWPRQIRPDPASGRRDCPARGRSWGSAAAVAQRGLRCQRLTHAVEHPLHPESSRLISWGAAETCRIKTRAKAPDIAAAVRPGAILLPYRRAAQGSSRVRAASNLGARKIPYLVLPAPVPTVGQGRARRAEYKTGRRQQSVQTTFSSRFPPVTPRWTRTFPAPESRPPSCGSLRQSARGRRRVPAWPIGLPCTIQRSDPLAAKPGCQTVSRSHAVGSVGLCRLGNPTCAPAAAPRRSAQGPGASCRPASPALAAQQRSRRPRLAYLLGPPAPPQIRGHERARGHTVHGRPCRPPASWPPGVVPAEHARPQHFGTKRTAPSASYNVSFRCCGPYRLRFTATRSRTGRVPNSGSGIPLSTRSFCSERQAAPNARRGGGAQEPFLDQHQRQHDYPVDLVAPRYGYVAAPTATSNTKGRVAGAAPIFSSGAAWACPRLRLRPRPVRQPAVRPQTRGALCQRDQGHTEFVKLGFE